MADPVVTKVEITFEGGLVRTLTGDEARKWQVENVGVAVCAWVHGSCLPAFPWVERYAAEPRRGRTEGLPQIGGQEPEADVLIVPCAVDQADTLQLTHDRHWGMTFEVAGEGPVCLDYAHVAELVRWLTARLPKTETEETTR